MPRARLILDGQWSDPEFQTCSPCARLLAIYVRNIADDYGVFICRNFHIKQSALPRDLINIDELWGELANHRLVCFRDLHLGGDLVRLGYIRNFVTFQKVRRPTSKHPLPLELDEWVGLKASDEKQKIMRPDQLRLSGNLQAQGDFFEKSRNYQGQLFPHTVTAAGIPTSKTTQDTIIDTKVATKFCHNLVRNADTLRNNQQPKTNQQKHKNKNNSSPCSQVCLSGFEEFWKIYPRKKGKAYALTCYAKALDRASHAEILDGVKNLVASNPEPRYTPHPSTWLNRDQWLDEYELAERSPEQQQASQLERLKAAAKEADSRRVAPHLRERDDG